MVPGRHDDAPAPSRGLRPAASCRWPQRPRGSRYLLSKRLDGAITCAMTDRPRSGSLAGFPDFLARPLPGPVQRGELVAGGGARLGLQLDEIFDLKTAAAQQPDHVAVPEVEFHRLIIGPLEAVHAE